MKPMNLKTMVLSAALAFGTNMVSPAAIAGDKEVKYGDWSHLHATDPLDDKSSHTAYVVSVEGGQVAMFFIKCDKAGHQEHGKPYAALTILKTHLGSSGESDVRYRIDGAQAVEQSWDLNGSSVVNLNKLDVATMASSLKAGTEFIIEARDTNYKAYRVTFSLRGSSKAIEAVFTGCKG